MVFFRWIWEILFPSFVWVRPVKFYLIYSATSNSSPFHYCCTSVLVIDPDYNKEIYIIVLHQYFHVTDTRLSDIVGSAYYVAPEVLHRSYSLEGDIWSIGVITYILLCGSRPFWARTESGIFRAVLRADPNFDDLPWPSVSHEAKDFVKRLLNKDYRKRMTAVQALSNLTSLLLSAVQQSKQTTSAMYFLFIAPSHELLYCPYSLLKRSIDLVFYRKC